MARVSIHFRASRPLLECPSRIRSIRPAGLVLAQRVDQRLADELIGSHAERGLCLDGSRELSDHSSDFGTRHICHLRHRRADALNVLRTHELENVGSLLLTE
jgi:hypothetical protein